MADGVAKGGFQMVAGAISKSKEDEFGHDGQMNHRYAPVVQVAKRQMGLPGLEKRFDPPAQAIARLQLPRDPPVRSDVGDEDVPAEQKYVFWAGVGRSIAVLAPLLAPTHVGDRRGDRNGHQPNGQPILVA